MQLLFTTLPSKKTDIRDISEDGDIILQRQLQQQQKQQNALFNATVAPDTFSNRTYFSNTSMFARVQSGITGCSSCALRNGGKPTASPSL